ncbi:MAG: hypothetical protein Q4C70_01390 [Planctomycetia bacterium]|nr:hypothetical protein [Planctomycetia bacterium]
MYQPIELKERVETSLKHYVEMDCFHRTLTGLHRDILQLDSKLRKARLDSTRKQYQAELRDKLGDFWRCSSELARSASAWQWVKR